MASVAERKRRHRLSVSRARAAAPLEASPPPPRTIRTNSYVRRQTGIECLAGRGKIDGRQRFSLERYGRLFRIASIEDGAALRSSIAELESAGGSVGGGLPTMENYANVLARGRQDLESARAVLSFQSALITACDLICGKGRTPQEITEVRTEQVELETSLRLAGDLLARHFDQVGWEWS